MYSKYGCSVCGLCVCMYNINKLNLLFDCFNRVNEFPQLPQPFNSTYIQPANNHLDRCATDVLQ